MSELGGACPKCGGPMDYRSKSCNACRLAAETDTPLRRWRARTGKSYGWLSRVTGIDHRALRRIAASGIVPKTRAAVLLHRYTGIPYAELLEGKS